MNENRQSLNEIQENEEDIRNQKFKHETMQKQIDNLELHFKEQQKQFETIDDELKKSYQNNDTIKQSNNYYEHQVQEMGKQKEKLNRSLQNYQKQVYYVEESNKATIKDNKDLKKIIDNFISIQEKLEQQNSEIGDMHKVKLSKEVLQNILNTLVTDNQQKQNNEPEISSKQRSLIFEQTMSNMKLVINYDHQMHKHHAKIYYHDKVNNVARMMVDQIALLSLAGSNELIQSEVIELEKKIKDP